MSVALLPIHPEYADAILSGEKAVEFRRRPFGKEVKHIVIYASSPVMRIVGHFEVGRIDSYAPSTVWRKFGKFGAISKQDFNRYYDGAEQAIAIHIKNAKKLGVPLKLKDLNEDFSAPQSYRYLCERTFEQVIKS